MFETFLAYAPVALILCGAVYNVIHAVNHPEESH